MFVRKDSQADVALSLTLAAVTSAPSPLLLLDGVDTGYQQSGVLVWAVIAPNDAPGQDALEGHYGGATAEGAFGVGLGADVLIGGSSKTIALQPVSIEGAMGLNVAAGIGELTLRSHHGD